MQPADNQGTAAFSKQGTASHTKQAAAQHLQVVTFRLRPEHYAVPIAQVQEVILCRDVARSFEMPVDVVGIYNLRGTIIPIVDLRKRLGVPGAPEERQQILICRVRDCVIGFVVDEVLQVTKIPHREIQQPPPSITARAPEHIIGISSQRGMLITILDIAARLSDPASTTAAQEE